MENKSKLLLFALVFVSLTACGTTGSPTYGPIAESDFPAIFSSNLDAGEEILFYSRAIWYPNKNGFKFLPAGRKSHKGIIVCTDRGVYFSEWGSGSGYSLTFTTTYEQIEAMCHARNELFGRLVIKKATFNSFEILGIDGPDLPDKEQTLVAFELIKLQAQS